MAIFKDHVDSDSAHSPSDDERKISVRQGQFDTLGHGQLPPDPDAHLSLEERAAIVCSDFPDLLPIDITPWLKYPRIGPQAPLENRPPPGEKAKSFDNRQLCEVATNKMH